MNMSTKITLCLVLFAGTLGAVSRRERVFLAAVKRGDMETAGRFIHSINKVKTMNKALRTAARNIDYELFSNLAPFASRKGQRHAIRSINRHAKNAGKKESRRTQKISKKRA